MTSSGTAYYLYCLRPAVGSYRGGLGDRTDGLAVSAVDFGGFTAIVSEVLLDEFQGEGADARLQDLKWLAPRACRHDSVIAEAMLQSPVLPARFATLFSSLAALEACLSRHRPAIDAYFSELGDKREWAVKGLLDRSAACQGLIPNQPDTPTDSPTLAGSRYLLQKRRIAQANRDLVVLLRKVCAQTALDLQAYAQGFRERKVIRDAAGSPDEMVLNWAFLVSRKGEEQFRSRLQQLAGDPQAPWLRFLLSGPWAPYSFAPLLAAEG